MTVLVSACLLGFACRHDGGDKRDDRVLRAVAGDEVVPFCPEMAAGFGVPRLSAWIDGSRVIDTSGADVTEQFQRGASLAVAAAGASGARLAILKQGSPSCGTLTTGTPRGRAPGEGLVARALRATGLPLTSEDQL